MAAQRDEEQKLEEILERRRIEGSSLKLEIMQKVPELVVHERMSQGKGVKGRKEKKIVQGWSIEEMKENHLLLTPVDVSVVPDVLDVLDVPVSPSSVANEFCDGFSFCSDWECVEPQSFSFSPKACSLLESYAARDEVRRLTSESASAIKKKNDAAHCKIRIHRLKTSKGLFEVKDHQTWSACDRTVIARTEQYLEESKSLKLEDVELESLLGPDDSDVDFRRILEEARDKKGCAVFEIFSSDGPSEFLVVS